MNSYHFSRNSKSSI